MTRTWPTGAVWLFVLAAFAVVTVFSPPAAIALAAGLAAICGIGRRFPQVGLLVVVALVPLDAIGQLETARVAVATLSVTKLVFIPALLVLVWNRVSERRPFEPTRQGTLVICFALAVLLSFALTGVHPYTFWSMRRFASAWLLFALTLYATEKARHVRYVLIAIVGACVLSAGVGVFEHLTGHNLLGIAWGDRASGASTVNPNTFATNILVAFLIALHFLLVSRPGRLRWILLGATGVLGCGIVLSFSRGVAVATVLSVLYLLYRVRKRVSRRRMTAIVCGMVVLGICAIPLIPAGYLERLASLVTEAGVDVSLIRRGAYHVIGLKLFARSPLWGVGPGSFPTYYMSPEFRYLTDTFGGGRLLHNLYLSIACQLGLIGLTCFLLLGWRAFRSLRDVAGRAPDHSFLQRAAEALNVALVAFLISSVFLPNEYQKYMWVLFALSAALPRILQSRDDHEPDQSVPSHSSP